MAAAPPTIDDLRAATASIAGLAVRTPLLDAPTLTAAIGRPVYVKPEVLQVTGSFKFRGACHFLTLLGPEERRRGVVAYSSGNHAQGVAAAAARFGVAATIVMPADAPGVKVERTRSHGGEVVLYDRATESREEIAAGIAGETGATLIPPYDHPRTIAGQGTVGIEIAADCVAAGIEDPVVVVPLGGGGLAAGIGIALETDLPGASLFGVEPVGWDDHVLSLAARKRVSAEGRPVTICDALLVPTPGEITFEVNRRLLAGAAAVTDEAVLVAIRLVFDGLRLVVEPGGAVGVAALLAGLVPGKGPVVVVLSGGNLDRPTLEAALDHTAMRVSPGTGRAGSESDAEASASRTPPE